MSFQTLNKTAEAYWHAFEHFQDEMPKQELFIQETEKLRFLCLLAFTSIDAQVNAYWVSRVLPEWSELLSLIDTVLNDNNELARIQELAGPQLNRAQLIASLRFIANTGEPKRFSPSLTDCGVIWLLNIEKQNANPHHIRIAQMLFQLQRIRNSSFHTGRDFNQLNGTEAIFLLNEWKEKAPLCHPAFLAANPYLGVPKPQAA